MSRKIAVIGGGASGMAAAVGAARAGAQTTVYERNDRVGKKLLSTGNGRCNFSNEKMDDSCYFGTGRALLGPVYGVFGPEKTRAFFEELGMRVKSRDGYLYPASGQASTVLDVLRYEMDRCGVAVHSGRLITEVTPDGDGFIVRGDGVRERYDAVILACGGRAAPGTGSDGKGYDIAAALGHPIVPTVPALTALRCREDFYRRAAGVRCDAWLTLLWDDDPVRSERGELQWTDYGISGIPVFQLSRDAAYGLRNGRRVSVRIDLLPDAGEDGGQDYERFWEARWRRQGWQTMEQFVTGLVNKKIGLLLLREAGIRERDTADRVTDEKRRRLEQLCRGLRVEVQAVNPYEQAQVCAGGVDCGQVTQSLESRLVPGLFFAGEILDIDGICGGYNLQWAWSSGMTAGMAAARKP